MTPYDMSYDNVCESGSRCKFASLQFKKDFSSSLVFKNVYMYFGF